MTILPTLAVTSLAVSLLVIVIVAAAAAATLAWLATNRARRAAHDLTRARARDALTGLPTREALEAAVDERLASGATPFGVLVIELDRFASVNESYGHEIGDRLLRRLSTHLEQLVEHDELLVRMGGPRLAVLSPAAHTSDAILARAAALADPLTARVHLGHDTLALSATVGGVAVERRFEGADAVVDAAMTALVVARTEGRGGRRTYDGTLRRPVSPTSAVDRMAHAMAHDELLVLYQPIVTLEDRCVAGVQAIPHWADPDRGIVPLPEWEEVLAASGTEVAVARHLLDQVVDQAGCWTRDHPDLDLVVTAWTPPALLADPETPYLLERRLAEAGLRPQDLCVSVAGRTRGDLLHTWAPLRELQDLGVQLALERFGVGWATLSYLRQFELDVIKVPAELVSHVGSSRDDEAIVQQVAGLANALGIVPIAEGVSTKEQADLLTSLGCSLGQGPWVARPQPGEAIEPLLARGTVAATAGRGGIDWRAPSW